MRTLLVLFLVTLSFSQVVPLWPNNFVASIVEWDKTTKNYSFVQLWYHYDNSTGGLRGQRVDKQNYLTSELIRSVTIDSTAYWYNPDTRYCDVHKFPGTPFLPPNWMQGAKLVGKEMCTVPGDSKYSRACYHWQKEDGEYWTDVVSGTPSRFNFNDVNFPGIWYFSNFQQMDNANWSQIFSVPSYCPK